MAKFTKVKKLSPWRKLSLLTWKKANDPTVYGQYEFDTTQLQSFLNDYNAKHQTKVTLTHALAKIMALCLKKYPAINGIIKWGTIYQRDSIDIFVQVAIAQENNDQFESLSGAKICNVDQKSLKQIGDELKLIAGEIRSDDDPQFKKTFNLTLFKASGS